MTDLPVKHLWERHMLDDEHVCCYSSTPSPGSEWVWGHPEPNGTGDGTGCRGYLQNFVTEERRFALSRCDCPHSTMQVIAVPEEGCADCGGTGKTRLKLKCATCNGTGTVVTHRLERGEVMEKPNLHLLLNPQTTAYFMDAGKFPALIFTPNLQSWESGEVGDWFQVERRLLG